MPIPRSFGEGGSEPGGGIGRLLLRNIMRNSLTLLFILAAAAPAWAQQRAAQQPPAPPRPATASTGPVLSISMDQAVTMALETNLGLKADRLGVNVAAEDIAIARAAFRPVIRSTFQRATSDH